MNRQFATIVCGLGIVLGAACTAEAQGITPRSTTGGNASRELRNIYMQSIGQGYTAESIIRRQRSRDRITVPQVGQAQFSGPVGSSVGSGLGVGSGSGLVSPSSKPFSSYSPLPTVSPYMNLFRDDFDGSDDFNYQTLVRPQIQQREFNERVQRELYNNSRRLQSIAAQSDFNIQGSRSMPATGHSTTFMYHSHYYPSSRRR